MGTPAAKPPWFRGMLVLVVIGWLFVDLALPLQDGWLRTPGPLAGRLLVAFLVFLVNTTVLGWCWGVGSRAERVEASEWRWRTASAILGLVVSVAAGVTRAGSVVLQSDPPGGSCDRILVAIGLLGCLLGAGLGLRHGRPGGNGAPAGR